MDSYAKRYSTSTKSKDGEEWKGRKRMTLSWATHLFVNRGALFPLPSNNLRDCELWKGRVISCSLLYL